MENPTSRNQMGQIPLNSKSLKTQLSTQQRKIIQQCSKGNQMDVNGRVVSMLNTRKKTQDSSKESKQTNRTKRDGDIDIARLGFPQNIENSNISVAYLGSTFQPAHQQQKKSPSQRNQISIIKNKRDQKGVSPVLDQVQEQTSKQKLQKITRKRESINQNQSLQKKMFSKDKSTIAKDPMNFQSTDKQRSKTKRTGSPPSTFNDSNLNKMNQQKIAQKRMTLDKSSNKKQSITKGRSPVQKAVSPSTVLSPSASQIQLKANSIIYEHKINFMKKMQQARVSNGLYNHCEMAGMIKQNQEQKKRINISGKLKPKLLKSNQSQKYLLGNRPNGKGSHDRTNREDTCSSNKMKDDYQSDQIYTSDPDLYFPHKKDIYNSPYQQLENELFKRTVNQRNNFNETPQFQDIYASPLKNQLQHAQSNFNQDSDNETLWNINGKLEQQLHAFKQTGNNSGPFSQILQSNADVIELDEEYETNTLGKEEEMKNENLMPRLNNLIQDQINDTKIHSMASLNSIPNVEQFVPEDEEMLFKIGHREEQLKKSVKYYEEMGQNFFTHQTSQSISSSSCRSRARSLDQIDILNSIEKNKELFIKKTSKNYVCDCDSVKDVQYACSKALSWLTIGNKRNFDYDKNTALYMNLLHSHCPSSSEGQIERDISRTFPNSESFVNNIEGQQKLSRVLIAFSKYDSNVGYVQGMNFIVGSLLHHCNEEIAFWLFVSLIEDYEMRDIYQARLPGLYKHSQVLQLLQMEHLDQIYRHFCYNGIQVEMYASDWIFALFSNIIPIKQIHLFFDNFFKSGWPFFYKFSLSFLKSIETCLLSTDDLSEILGTIKLKGLKSSEVENQGETPHQPQLTEDQESSILTKDKKDQDDKMSQNTSQYQESTFSSGLKNIISKYIHKNIPVISNVKKDSKDKVNTQPLFLNPDSFRDDKVWEKIIQKSNSEWEGSFNKDYVMLLLTNFDTEKLIFNTKIFEDLPKNSSRASSSYRAELQHCSVNLNQKYFENFDQNYIQYKLNVNSIRNQKDGWTEHHARKQNKIPTNWGEDKHLTHQEYSPVFNGGGGRMTEYWHNGKINYYPMKKN